MDSAHNPNVCPIFPSNCSSRTRMVSLLPVTVSLQDLGSGIDVIYPRLPMSRERLGSRTAFEQLNLAHAVSPHMVLSMSRTQPIGLLRSPHTLPPLQILSGDLCQDVEMWSPSRFQSPGTIGFATDEHTADKMPPFFASKPTFVTQVDEKKPREAKSITGSSVTTMISWWLKEFRYTSR